MIKYLAKTKRKKAIRLKSSNRVSGKTLPKLRTFSDGFMFVDPIIRKFNAQPNPPKVYWKGNRIHHGFVGLALSALGYIIDHPPAIGAGARLMLDDLADIGDWFNFKDSRPIVF